MGRSVSYPSEALVVTFATLEDPECGQCEGTGSTDAMGEEEECPVCDGRGTRYADEHDYDELIDDFRQHLQHLFPSVEQADDWIGREDHVLAENGHAQFGMSEYCGLVSYWIVPKESPWRWGGDNTEGFAQHWVRSVADKFVAAFGELTKVGSMSNGEGVYRRIDK